MATNRINLRKVLDSAARKAVALRSSRVLPVAKSKAGADGASLRYTVRGNSHTDVTGRVESTDPKFIFIEEGVKPHIIRPKNGKALKFPGLGSTAYAAVVFHPGIPGKHPLKKALRETNR